MTGWKMVSCWAVAAVTAVLILSILGRPLPQNEPELGSPDVVVLGTSLMRFGIPANPAAGMLLAGEGEHIRMGLPGASRPQITRLLELAINSGARHVLIEANPLLLSFAKQAENRECASLTCELQKQTTIKRLNFSNHIRELVSGPAPYRQRLLQALEEPDDWPQSTSSPGADAPYPMVFHADAASPDLQRQIERARTQGTEITLILPPRSPLGERLLGPDQSAELLLRAQDLARQINAPLFAPLEGWQQEHFTDHAHLNRAGRARFLAELQQWWPTRR